MELGGRATQLEQKLRVCPSVAMVHAGACKKMNYGPPRGLSKPSTKEGTTDHHEEKREENLTKVFIVMDVWVACDRESWARSRFCGKPSSPEAP